MVPTRRKGDRDQGLFALNRPSDISGNALPQRVRRVWHADRNSRVVLNLKTMNTPLQPYQKLKRQAKRLMMIGDLERYLYTLRAMNELRLLQRRGLA